MKRVLVILGVCFVTSGFANAEERKPAVDVADSMNVNAPTECDYGDSGLNGVVQGWFKRDASSPASSRGGKITAAEQKKVSPPVGDAESLAKARYELLRLISGECAEGFRINDELYLPAGEQMVIALAYGCL